MEKNSKMRVYQLDRPGSVDGLVLTERSVPSPAVGEVLVRVRASSLNFRDLMIINGQYPMPVPPGRVPLSDGAGEVVAVGAGVTRFKVGIRGGHPTVRFSRLRRADPPFPFTDPAGGLCLGDRLVDHNLLIRPIDVWEF